MTAYLWVTLVFWILFLVWGVSICTLNPGDNKREAVISAITLGLVSLLITWVGVLLYCHYIVDQGG